MVIKFGDKTQQELDDIFNWGPTAPETPRKPVRPPVRITYTVSVGEPVHPDPSVASRFFEMGIGDCEFGCKVYGDPISNVRVLAHNSAYGCSK